MTKEEMLIREVENKLVNCILDDIDFGYDLATIKGKIKFGSYVGNSPETFKENERVKSELLGNPEQLKVEREWISVDDRLPEIANNYIVYIPEFIEQVTTREFAPEFNRFLDTRITHWMPLPNPPKQ